MPKIRILTLSTSGLKKMEGIATILSDYFSVFDKSRFEITMIAEGEIAADARKAFENAGVRLLEAPARKASLPAYLNFLRKHAKEYDIFYLNGSSALTALDLGAIRMGNPSIIEVVESHNTTTTHALQDKLLRPLFYSLCDDRLACSKEAGQWLFRDRPFQLVRNGRDPQKYRYNEAVRKQMRKNLGLKDSTLAVGHVGNLNAWKNQQYLIRSFEKLQNKQPDARLYLMGIGFKEPELKALVKELHLEDKVIFTGMVPNAHEMIQAMDVMALPSLHEGLPLVVVEWQMACLPVIVSDSVTRECAFSDLVEFLPLEAGYEAWADAILKASRTDRKAHEGSVLRQAREAGFDLAHSARDLQKHFEALYEQKHASAAC